METTAQAAPWVVLKFGGTSVHNRASWERVMGIIDRHHAEGRRVMVVCSAMRGVSDALDALCGMPPSSQALLQRIADAHLAWINAMELAEAMPVWEAAFADLQAMVLALGPTDPSSRPALQASIMAFGELTLTRLAALYVQQYLPHATWLDAREALTSSGLSPKPYLQAQVAIKPDLDFAARWQQEKTLVLTQGYVASNASGETVVLGRGGSDTSAAYFSVKLQAELCEIWTDVAGVFTANPRLLPEARLVPQLHYDEARELALMGAKVLHPSSLEPLRQQAIPLRVRSTHEPALLGTHIHAASSERSVIKSIVCKKQQLILQIDAMSMWHQAGFLARLFAAFAEHALSINHVSTSETSVTLSLDETLDQLCPDALEALLCNLKTFASVRIIKPCASISLIGKHMRRNISQLSQCLSLLTEKPIYLVSQSAHDLNYTFMVDESEADRLLQKMHHLLLMDSDAQPPKQSTRLLQTAFYSKQDWWVPVQQSLLEDVKSKLPCYVYHRPTLDQAAQAVLSLQSVDRTFYSVKANHHEGVLQHLERLGMDFECVSIQEVRKLMRVVPDLSPKRILFTPNFVHREEYEEALALGVLLTLDSITPLQQWPEVFEGQSLYVRVDPNEVLGRQAAINTGGGESKFGITVQELMHLAGMLPQLGCKVVGLHAHAGSGILSAQHWRRIADCLVAWCAHFPDVTVLNCGGGLGVQQKPGLKGLDLQQVDAALADFKRLHPRFQLWLEPGRFVVAECGILLARVTQVKRKPQRHFIGLETGMNSLVRPAMYGAYHHIINLSRLHEPCTVRAHVVGPICEPADCFGYERLLPQSYPGDVMLISHVGAYGHSMASHYNLREPAQAHLFDE